MKFIKDLDFNSSCYLLSLYILYIIGTTSIINAAFLLLGFRITYMPIIISISLGVILLIIYRKLRSKMSIFILTVLVLFSYSISKEFYDISWDGQWYHQDAIIKIYEGWNVFDQRYVSYDVTNSDMWIYHYPKANWLLSANLLGITNNIQSTKMITILLIASLFFTTCFTLKKVNPKISIFTGILFSLAVCLNPVVCYQLFSFYVDAQSYCLLSLVILLLINLSINKTKSIYFLIFFVIVYAINIKFTNLVYILIFTFYYVIYDFSKIKKINSSLILFFSGVYIISILFVGSNSYLNNYLKNNNPLYPLLGENNYGAVISEVLEPSNFNNLNRIEKFALSILSEPKYSRAPLNAEIRIPFTKTNYQQYYRTDPEVAGFGSIYSEILILLFIGFILLIITGRIKLTQNFFILFIICAILNSLLVNSQMYVARYVPQFWFLTVLLIYCIYHYGNTFFKYYSIALAMLVIINSYFILNTYYTFNLEAKNNIKNEIKFLKSLESNIIEVNFVNLSVKRRLEENLIPYKLNNELNINTPNVIKFNYTNWGDIYIIK